MKRLFSLLLFGLLIGLAAAEPKVPQLTGRVVDQAKIFGASGAEKIDAAIRALETATGGGQMAVLTVDTLDGTPIEEFGIRVMDQWKIGRKGKDDGAILIDGQQIDVNAGLEGAGTCASLTSDEIFFKGGGGYSTTKVYKFNYKTGVTSLFVDIADKSLFSMVSKYMATDPEGHLYVPTTNYSEVVIGVFDIATGAQLNDVQNEIGAIKGDGGIFSTYALAE